MHKCRGLYRDCRGIADGGLAYCCSAPEVKAAPAVLDPLSVEGAGNASPSWPLDCAELSGGESTWIATGFEPEFGDGLATSAGAGSELLPSCGMGGRLFSKSLSPYRH